ncbi:hypothetical protein AO1008_08650 [Aspergillus oryzae 100-8]|uniref:Uncharacterized protein n=1 Tax=Aspergillus oryzae (strain 3.042) TaxID=1160506 RepID=I7ZMB3_ASPO3|nr:hypothetical protein Ao3042_11002 [Aspergillus oryzae 3.042]KDE82083.1 hypothetical protein AO1008_08650 [Aspergillus oryzae 100-8]|eukprot:EIT73104.1 hypothetical protein Ao3042_11002 [Aspergillus oryzae 3.042]
MANISRNTEMRRTLVQIVRVNDGQVHIQDSFTIYTADSGKTSNGPPTVGAVDHNLHRLALDLDCLSLDSRCHHFSFLVSEPVLSRHPGLPLYCQRWPLGLVPRLLLSIFRSSVVTLLKNLRRWVIRLNLGPVADLLVLRDKTGEREVGKLLKSQTFDIKSSILIGTLGNPQPTREPSTVSLTRVQSSCSPVLKLRLVLSLSPCYTPVQYQMLEKLREESKVLSGTNTLSLSLRTFNTWSARLRLYQLSLEDSYAENLKYKSYMIPAEVYNLYHNPERWIKAAQDGVSSRSSSDTACRIVDNISATRLCVEEMSTYDHRVGRKFFIDQIYYLACGNGQVANPGAWNVPFPVVDGAEHISPYVNMADGGNTIFASDGGRIYRDVKLAAPPAQKSLSFKSYTTTLHVSDPNNLPVANSQLEISTDSRTPGNINGVYYVLGVEPVKIKTDATGVATVIQETENINCAVLKVEAGAGTTQAVINPRMKSFEKLGQLDSASSLRHASFPTNTVAGGMRGSPQFSPLVESSVMEADVNAVAQGMKSLKTAYSHIQTPDLRSRKLFNLNCDVIPADLGHGLEITGSMIALGDLFLLLKSATDATSNVVWNAANDAWHFIVQIAEQVYHTVLDTVDAIVGTIEWIFNSVKTAITKIIRYVEFLFEWDDIRRTKDVMYNITKLFFQHQIDGISEEKKDFETMITSAEQSLGEFAGFSDWSNLGDAAKQPASANVKNPATGQTPGSQMLGNHYRTHAGDLRIVQYPVPSSKIEKDSVQRSLDGQLGDVAKEFGLMEIKAALEKLAVIIVDGILSSTWVVVDTLLDLQKELATAGFDALAAKLHIPIISDILNEIGIEDVSLLDFFTWISVTSFNVVYKIATNTAPFLDNEDVQALITAKSWDELTPLFHTPSSMTTDLIVLVCGNLEPTLPRLDTA